MAKMLKSIRMVRNKETRTPTLRQMVSTKTIRIMKMIQVEKTHSMIRKTSRTLGASLSRYQKMMNKLRSPIRVY
jgi:hypothetical protein